LIQDKWKRYEYADEDCYFDMRGKSLERRKEVSRLKLCLVNDYVQQIFCKEKADY
jgi:hypothetical protein